MKFDTIVIGGGLAGVSIFHALAARSVEVALIEGASDIACGASFANGAMITPSMSDPWNGPGVGRHLASSLFDPGAAMRLRIGQIPRLVGWGLSFLRNSSAARHLAATDANFRLAHYSLGQTRRLASEIGLEVNDSPNGTLKIFQTEEAMVGPLRLAARLAAKGLRYNILNADEVVAMEPALAPSAGRVAGGLHYPDDIVGDARCAAVKIASAGRRAGGILRTGNNVHSVVADRDRYVVITDGESYSAKRIVISSGFAAPKLATSLGFSLPIQPAKGYSLTYGLEGSLGAPRMAIVDDAMHAAIVPIGGDRIRIAGTAEFAGADTAIDERRLDNLAQLFAKIYPELAGRLDRGEAQGWAGLRPMSADGRPLIGESPRRGVWINAGHGHLGWTMAAGSAALLADLMLGCTPAIDPTPFAIGNARP